MTPLSRIAALFALTLVCAAGCSSSPPAVVEASGVLLLDGQPLPHAKVEFIPQLKNFGAEMNSTAITDDNGRFTLMFGFASKPGAAVALHHVVVTEGPPPADLRGQSPEAQTRLGEYQKRLKNRPIPPEYGNVALTRLRVEVKPDQKEYKLEMTRKP
jgi:hypothetical protein